MDRPGVDRSEAIAAGVVALLALLLVGQLLVQPIVGLADTEDFSRLWRWFGIESPTADHEQRYFRYLIREWKLDAAKAESSGFLAADLLFIAASMPLNDWLARPGVYDIRSLSAVRIVVLLFASFLLVRVAGRGGLVMQGIVALALLFVVADVGYIAYFNSGFTEPASLLFALLTIAFFVRLVVGEGVPTANFWAFAASAVLLIWSKPQNVLLALPLAFLAWRLGSLGASPRWRAGALAVIVVIVTSAALYRSNPPPLWYTQQIRHIAVFNGLLPASPDPAADLRTLGIDPRWTLLSGQFPWSVATQQHAAELQTQFHDRIDDRALVKFYLRHPGRALALLKLSASQALAVRVGLGQFEASTGRPAFTRAKWFALRSDFVRDFGPHRFRWVVALLAAATLVACVAWWSAKTRPSRLLAEGAIMLAVAAVLQYVTVAVLQGPVAVSKGMFLFAFFYDATMAAAVALIAARIPTIRR